MPSDVPGGATIEPVSTGTAPTSVLPDLDVPAPAGGARPESLIAASALLAALPLLVMLAVLVAQHPRITASGDRAVTTLEVRDLLAGHQLVGAYSRFGWHHPGPAFLVPLAAAELILGRAQWLLDAGMLVTGMAFAALVVVAVGRAAGPLPAAATAGLIGLYVRAIGPATLRDPWNPWGVLLPIVLLTVLCGLAATGSLAALGGAALVASIAVQTHVGAAPISLALFAAGAVLTWQSRRGREGSDAPGPAVWAAVVATIAIWTPPLVQEATGHDPNLTDLWRFFVSAYPGHSLSTAVATVGDRLGQFPLGSVHRLMASNAGVGWAGVGGAGIVVAAYVAAGAALTVIGRRRDDRFASALGVLTVVGVLAAVLGVRSIEGPLAGYVVASITALPVGCWIGLTTIALRSWRRRSLAATLAAVALALAGTAAATTAAAAAPSTRTEDAPSVRAAWASLRPALADRRRGAVLLEVSQLDDWPTEAGLALELEEHGWQAHVTDDWVFMFGDRRQETGTERLVATIGPSGVTVTTPLSPAALAADPTRVAQVLGGSGPPATGGR